MTHSAKLTEILSLPTFDEQITALDKFISTREGSAEALADPRYNPEWLRAHYDEIIRRAMSK